MEYINTKRKPNMNGRVLNPFSIFAKKHPYQSYFQQDCKTTNFSYHQLEHKKIIEAIHKSYLLFFGQNFLYKNVYPDEKNNTDHQDQKEPMNVSEKKFKVEKKGFESYQYEANNPIEDSMISFQIPQLNAFFVSIFDGHGGPQLSKYCEKHFQKIIKKFINLRFKMPKYQNKEVQLIKQALSSTHHQIQNNYYNLYYNKSDQNNKKSKGVGTCAITLVVCQGKCIVATCGDSQAIIIQQNQGSYNYKKLSEKFSVNNKSQRQRIQWEFKGVEDNVIVEQRKNVYYLKGMLQPTKSIGDYYLKHQQHYFGQDQFNGPYLTCEPDIKIHQFRPHDKYIVIASDGLWDYLSKWEVLKYIIDCKKDKSGFSERQTQSENQDYVYEKSMNAVTYLGEKILQKVANDLDTTIQFLKSIELGSRRSYHDDITIGLIDIKQFFDLDPDVNNI